MPEQHAHSFGTSAYVTTADGRRLHYMSKGSVEPTVVFESGMGFSRSTWGLVQPVVGERVRAVVYDRAGLGKSDPDSASRTLSRLADDLGSLLDHLGGGPFILVGHSWGGPIVRAAAAADPSRIRGIVLADPSDENCDLYFAPSAAKWYAISRHLMPLLARLGLYRRLYGRLGLVQPEDVAADHHAEDFTMRAVRTMLAESATFLQDLALLRSHPPQLGALEVSVISGTLVAKSERRIRPAIVSAHQRSVDQMMNGTWVASPRSGHFVMFTEPQVIIDEIGKMLPGNP